MNRASHDYDDLDMALRDALAPLDRDPGLVAEDVLARLPISVEPPLTAPPTGLPPLSWWLAAGGLCVGLAAGWWLRSPEKDASQPATNANNSPANPSPNEGDPEVPRKPVDGPAEGPSKDPNGGLTKDGTADKPDYLTIEVRLLGPVAINEPDAPREELPSGAYMVAPGTRFFTGPSLAGGMLLPDGVLFRLDRETECAVGPGSYVGMRSGQAWLATDLVSERLVVETDTGRFILEGGAMMIAHRDPNETTVWCLKGQLQLSTADRQSASLQGGQRLLITDRGIGEVATVDFVGPATSWMTPFVLLQMDPSERDARVEDMVRALANPDYREAAGREVRKLGAITVPALMRTLADCTDPDLQRSLLRLINQVADYSSAKGLLPWLMVDDERVRRSLFETLVRVTGMDRGTGHQFWAEAPKQEREQVVQEWIEAIR